MTNLSDSEVVARVLAGDRCAFSILAERYGQRVFRVAIAITKDPDAAEDCLQQTFLLALDRLGQFRAEAQFSTWLTRIAVNAAIAHLRRHGRREAHSIPIDGTADAVPTPPALIHPGEDPETAFYRRELRQALQRALATLSPRLRAVLVLRDIEGLDTQETAQVLGLTEGTVKTRLLRARLKMRQRLEPWLKQDRRPQTFRWPLSYGQPVAAGAWAL